ncbi:MAG: hypothetical protein KF778_06465 [Rhodocyclaceae bacterium]|nr:hypothetical protein [Rhodocyclaceae bacterium]MBX3668029.1 hypothetical protein [Rhodocyclaceae bacterium]
MGSSLSDAQVAAALRSVEEDAASAEEKTTMLMEIAMGLQLRPKSVDQLQQAVGLYERALDLCPQDAPLLSARVRARLGTALQALPENGNCALDRARACFESARGMLKERGSPEELAELDMNLGLALQALAGNGAARITDAIQSYQKALRVFVREQYPQEFAILHNNLAIAYLSIPLADEHAKMREALAVQSFEEVLKVITLIDHPSEYAMAQNNLGNALQYAHSGHPLDNSLRALAAYDEALKVRNPRDTPIEYANTIANKANVLRNLPDEESGTSNLMAARALYREACDIFELAGQRNSAAIVREVLAELEQELRQANAIELNGMPSSTTV